jgi:hypothetical protein
MYPDQCEANNFFSIQVPIRFDSIRAMEANALDRNSAMFGVPAAQWRGLTVTNAATGESERVEVRLAGIGSRYRLSHTAADLTGASSAIEGHRLLWGGGPYATWVYAPPPCLYSGVGFYGDIDYGFFWKTPVQGTCVKTPGFRIPAMTYEYLDFAYELRTPNPLNMSSGRYTGTFNYTIGPGSDIDMGDVMIPNDTYLGLHFVLDVQHTLKVDIPPGGEKISLVPAGGWQSWLQAGRRPVRLFRDQTFNISASSRFKMLVDCDISIVSHECLIQDQGSTRAVKVLVSVSLPNGLMDMSGQPVQRRQIKPGPNNAQQFQPGFYVDRAPGILHFEIPPDQMTFMLQPGRATVYSGNITVIWDSEV